MSHITLHQFAHSHFCIRIRWAMAFKGMDFTVRNYTPKTIEEVEKISGGWRMVPVLQWEDQFITDSPRIARFLESKKPSPTLYPEGASAALCEMVAGWVDTKVMLSAAKLIVGDILTFLPSDEDRARYRNRFQGMHGMAPEEALSKRAVYEKEVNAHIQLLDEQLSREPFLLGSRLSYADLAVASRFRLMDMVARFKIPGEFAQVTRWYQTIRALGD